MKKLFFVTILFSFLSCGSRTNNDKINVNQSAQSSQVMEDNPSTSIEGLSSLIAVPAGVTDVKWQTIRIGTGELGPSDAILLAVMQNDAALP